MTTPKIPSKPPGTDNNLGAILEWILRKDRQRFDVQLPARVISYDRAKNVARVQPLIAMVGTDGKATQRASIASVPVLALGGGGFFINFPLAAGDLGWIEASDRDISLFVQNLNSATPGTIRLHTFQDARFVPDVFRQYTFTPADGAMVISSLDGATRVELSDGVAKIIAPSVQVQCTTYQVTAQTSITMNAPTLTFQGENLSALISGTSTFSGGGSVTLPTATTIAGRNFLTHNHSGVTIGTSNSGNVV